MSLSAGSRTRNRQRHASVASSGPVTNCWRGRSDPAAGPVASTVPTRLQVNGNRLCEWIKRERAAYKLACLSPVETTFAHEAVREPVIQVARSLNVYYPASCRSDLQVLLVLSCREARMASCSGGGISAGSQGRARLARKRWAQDRDCRGRRGASALRACRRQKRVRRVAVVPASSTGATTLCMTRRRPRPACRVRENARRRRCPSCPSPWRWPRRRGGTRASPPPMAARRPRRRRVLQAPPGAGCGPGNR